MMVPHVLVLKLIKLAFQLRVVVVLLFSLPSCWVHLWAFTSVTVLLSPPEV